jgi:hypothetical protein
MGGQAGAILVACSGLNFLHLFSRLKSAVRKPCKCAVSDRTDSISRKTGKTFSPADKSPSLGCLNFAPTPPPAMPTEADTCRKFVVPKLQAAGWDNEPHSIAEQRTITDGRVVPVGKGFIRKPPKRVDYLLRYTRDFNLAVVEAKAGYKTAADAVQQARVYAEMLQVKFAYATNGQDIIEIDYFTGKETRVTDYTTRRPSLQ